MKKLWLIPLTLVSLIFFLGLTQLGLTTSIALTKHFLPGKLRIASAEGKLFTGVRIYRLAYDNEHTSLHIRSANYRWNIFYLFLGNIHLDQVTADHISFSHTSSEKTPGSKTHFSLPNLDIENANITNVQYQRTTLQAIEISAKIRKDKISIDHLKLIAAPYQLSAQGVIHLQFPYATKAWGNFSNQTPRQKTIHGKFILSGDFNALSGKIKITDPFTAVIETRLQDMTHLGSFSAEGHWAKLLWPLDASHVLKSEQGRLQVRGSLKQYHFELTTQIGGTSIPKGEWQLQGSGSNQSIDLTSLTAETLNGSLTGAAKIAWSPAFTWQANLEITHLNPGLTWHAYPGDLTGQLTTSGNLSEKSWAIKMPRLSGRFRAQPISGHFALRKTSDTFVADTSTLTFGQNIVTIHGVLSHKLNFSWHINAPDLTELSQQTGGNLISEGQLRGSLAAPHIMATASSQDLRILDYRIQNLTLATQLYLDSQQYSSLTLQASGLHGFKQKIEAVSIQGQGTALKHHLKILVTEKSAVLFLKIKGRFQNQLWQTTIPTFTIHSQKFGNWKISQAFDFSIGQHLLHLQNFKLIKGKENLSANISFEANAQAAEIHAAHLNLGSFFPNLTTDLNADFTLTQKLHRYAGNLVIQLASGKISYVTKGQKNAIVFKPSKLTAILTSKQANAAIDLDSAQNIISLHGKLTLPKYRGFGIPAFDTPVEGNIQANIQSLAFLKNFLTTSSEIEGQLTAHAHIEGALFAPDISGNISLSQGEVILPAFGLHLTNIGFTLDFTPNQLFTVNGKLQSQGVLSISGGGSLFPNFSPSEFLVSGENILIMNTKQYHIVASPHITIHNEFPNISVSGSVDFPSASITPEDFTNTVELPSNTIIIQKHATKENTPFITPTVNLTVSAGPKNIRVKYHGLDAALGGKITIQMLPGQMPIANGTLATAEGHYTAYGQSLSIQTGELLFFGGPLNNPAMNILATKIIKVDKFNQSTPNSDVVVGVEVRGTIDDPQIGLYSNQGLSNTDTLSYLLFGQPMNQVSGDNAQLLVQAASVLGLGGKNITGNMQNTFHLDQLGFESTQVYSPTTGSTQTSSFVVGKNITKKLSVSYSIGILVPISVLKILYQWTEHWALQQQTSSYGESADVLYIWEGD